MKPKYETRFWTQTLAPPASCLAGRCVCSAGVNTDSTDKKTKEIWEGNRVRSLPLSIQKKGRLKLRMLNNAQNIADLRIPPGNKLKKLSGNLKENYSIRINEQWRIIFIWQNGNARSVQICDYH